MARLLERTVQIEAQRFLEKRYKRRARGRMYSQLEVRTKKEYGGKRADGFLAFRHWLWGTYTVSVEAKSYKTLPAVKPYYDTRKFLLNCARAGLAFSILTGAFFYLFTKEYDFVQFLLPITMFLMGAMIFGLLSFSSFRNYKMKVISQLLQYPANEQWLAFSSDTLADISSDKIKKIKSLCQRRGVGLLLVRQKGRIEEVVKPQRKLDFFGDYLKYYSNEQLIKETIG